MWTGKPNSKIEEIIEDHASNGWRLVQILQDHAAMWYKGRVFTKIVFEKRVASDFYQNHNPNTETVSDQEFV